MFRWKFSLTFSCFFGENFTEHGVVEIKLKCGVQSKYKFNQLPIRILQKFQKFRSIVQSVKCSASKYI